MAFTAYLNESTTSLPLSVPLCLLNNTFISDTLKLIRRCKLWNCRLSGGFPCELPLCETSLNASVNDVNKADEKRGLKLMYVTFVNHHVVAYHFHAVCLHSCFICLSARIAWQNWSIILHTLGLSPWFVDETLGNELNSLWLYVPQFVSPTVVRHDFILTKNSAL